MKTTAITAVRSYLAGVLALAATPFAGAADRGRQQDQGVTVEFHEPDSYTDFKTSLMGGSKEREALMDRVREHVRRAANRYLPPDYSMHLRFRDIDMAGHYEPEQGPNLDEVRIVRGIYPPSIHVEYEVQDHEGNVVARGQRRLSDLTFQHIASFRQDEPLFYVGELIIDLFRDVTRNMGS